MAEGIPCVVVRLLDPRNMEVPKEFMAVISSQFHATIHRVGQPA
jgi:hypothetical protein